MTTDLVVWSPPLLKAHHLGEVRASKARLEALKDALQAERAVLHEQARKARDVGALEEELIEAMRLSRTAVGRALGPG